MIVHRVGNRSTMDRVGRLVKFLAETLCGLPLKTPRLLTNQAAAVTCGRCRRIQKQWEPGYWEQKQGKR